MNFKGVLVSLIIILVLMGLSMGGGILIDRYALAPLKCPKCPEQAQIEEKHHHNVVTDPTPQGKYCGEVINAEATLKGRLLTVDMWDKCKRGKYEYELKYPNVLYKYTIMPSILAGVGYLPELKKWDALVGGELDILRNYKWFGVGGGVWYIQGINTKFKQGGAKATLAFSFGHE